MNGSARWFRFLLLGIAVTTIVVVAADSGAGTNTGVVLNTTGFVASDTSIVKVPVGPQITTQPVDVSVGEGSAITLTLSVTATGDPSPTYQWFFDDVAISGATESILKLTEITAAREGNYFVQVSNSVGTVQSRTAVVTVFTKPVFVTQPVATVTQPRGTTVALDGVATAKPSPTYQWNRDGAPIAGATASTLTLTNVAEDHSGTYTLVATNQAGSTTSQSSVVTLYGPPEITAQPPPLIVLPEKETLTINVGVRGISIQSQWRFNGQPLADASSPTLRLSPVTTAMSGDYQLVLTNPAGTVMSTVAKVRVQHAPIVRTQPVEVLVSRRERVVFSVEAIGDPIPVYQWYRVVDSTKTPLNGQTRPELVIPAADWKDQGSYAVEIKNAIGTVMSQAVKLRLRSIPRGPTVQISSDGSQILIDRTGGFSGVENTGDVRREH